MKKDTTIRIALLALTLVMAACGSKKNLVDNSKGMNTATTVSTTENVPGDAPRTNDGQNVNKAEVLAKVMANVPSANSMVANIDFNLKSGSKDITVDGKLSMKRDEVIRIQLTPMGLVEVGRLEFTRDSVLIMDRIHKQYLKSSYSQVSFLKNNGIDFHALQALFWNQLFVPGEKSIGQAQLDRFDVNGNQVALQIGKMNYNWVMDDVKEHINSAAATYNSRDNGTSKLDWTYGNFKKFADGLFPAQQDIELFTKVKGSNKTIHFGMTLKSMKVDNKWDSYTSVSSKYKPVELSDVINQILKIK